MFLSEGLKEETVIIRYTKMATGGGFSSFLKGNVINCSQITSFQKNRAKPLVIFMLSCYSMKVVFLICNSELFIAQQ